MFEWIYFYNMDKAGITYIKALKLTAIGGILLFIINYIIGTNNFFLQLNADGGYWADHLFHYLTYLGDGIMWVPLMLYVLFRKKDQAIFVLAAIIISTLITHLFKDILIPNEARPTKAIADINLIHIVKGVSVHTIGSFPSGHTTTAFCIYLIVCRLFNNEKLLIPLFVLALIVGYSRVYLAQHFPRDVAGGMLAAVFTLIFSQWVEKAVRRKKVYPHPLNK